MTLEEGARMLPAGWDIFFLRGGEVQCWCGLERSCLYIMRSTAGRYKYRQSGRVLRTPRCARVRVPAPASRTCEVTMVLLHA